MLDYGFGWVFLYNKSFLWGVGIIAENLTVVIILVAGMGPVWYKKINREEIGWCKVDEHTWFIKTMFGAN